MYNIINPPFMDSQTPPALPMYDYAIRNLNKELQRVIFYYLESIFVIPNTHILRKIVNEFEIYLRVDPETLADTIRAESLYLCKSFGLNSALHMAGVSSRSHFYNQNNPEAYVYIEHDFNPQKIYDNYRSVSAVRVLQHGFTDLCYPIPNGDYGSDQKNLCCFSIDLAMLAVQYKAWVDKEQYVEDKDMNLPLHSFIHKYVLCNMIASHMDIAIFNRLVHLLKHGESIGRKSNHPFTVADYSDKIDSAHRSLIDIIKKKPSDYVYRLDAIPSMHYGTYRRSMNLPDIAPTRNIKWFLILSKLDALEYLIDTDAYNDNIAISLPNRRLLKLELDYMRNEKALLMQLPDNVRQRLEKIHKSLG